MKVFTSAEQIRNALETLQPSHIAVAYVGANWKRYVNADHLKEIIVSPRLGSNPRAIEKLMKVIGHENVHLLDNLHSKIYLGAGAVMLGSCNLSDNGLSDQGLFEVVTLSESKDVMTQLSSQWESYKSFAQFLYPTRRAKLDRLRMLKEETALARKFGLADGPVAKSPPIQQYESKLDRVHVVWCGTSEDDYDQARIRKAVPAIREVSPDDYFAYTMQFLEEDDVRPGDWVLCWACKNNGLPRKGGDVSWFYVHHVVSRGFDTDDYPKLVGEAKPSFLKRPAPPFALDQATKALIRKTLALGQYPELLSLDDSLWRLAPADAVTPAFIKALRKASRADAKR